LYIEPLLSFVHIFIIECRLFFTAALSSEEIFTAVISENSKLLRKLEITYISAAADMSKYGA